jgi:hypothetical protein
LPFCWLAEIDNVGCGAARARVPDLASQAMASVVLLLLVHLSTTSVVPTATSAAAPRQRPAAALLPLWNSAFNATQINGHAQGRAACPGPAIDFAAFGIGANNQLDAPYGGTTGGYNGDAVATLHYDFGMTGLVPYYLPDGTAVNGGLPQLMNMSAHLEQWRRDIERQFPDRGFSGVVSLDWEAWFPLWEVNMADDRLWIYANKSRELVRTQRPGATAAEVEVAAKEAWRAGTEITFFLRRFKCKNSNICQDRLGKNTGNS